MMPATVAHSTPVQRSLLRCRGPLPIAGWQARFAAFACLCLLWLSVGSVQAQTRAWLDRDRIALGETTTLNIETDQPAVAGIDSRALERDFEVTGQSSRRSFESVNGVARSRLLLAYALSPRRAGELEVPSLAVGGAMTQPLRLSVAGGAAPVQARGEVFIETAVDSAQPWVQQAVGYVVRLYSAVPLVSGTLEQDAPEGASLRRVGDDAQYSREVGGRRYTVVERRYLLVPERSGALRIPGARFNGQGVGGYFDQWFGDGRRSIAASGTSRDLQVRAPPDNAPLPWLPLHGLQLRWLQAPQTTAAGEAARATLELVADGAQATQLPDLQLQPVAGVQVFAEPPQVEETFVDGRPRLRLLRSFALVGEAGGAVRMPGPRLQWWDVNAGIARTASASDLQWQVQGTGRLHDAPPADADGSTATPGGGMRWIRLPYVQGEVHLWSLIAALFALAWLVTLIWALLWRHRRPREVARTTHVATAPTLRQALAGSDLAMIEHALLASATPPATGLDALAERLQDEQQRHAIALLQQARWQGGDAEAVLRALRKAFAKGPHWRATRRLGPELLPPLYPR